MGAVATDQENTSGIEILSTWGKRTGGPIAKEKTYGNRIAEKRRKYHREDDWAQQNATQKTDLGARKRHHKDNSGNGKTKGEIEMGATQSLPSQ